MLRGFAFVHWSSLSRSAATYLRDRSAHSGQAGRGRSACRPSRERNASCPKPDNREGRLEDRTAARIRSPERRPGREGVHDLCLRVLPANRLVLAVESSHSVWRPRRRMIRVFDTAPSLRGCARPRGINQNSTHHLRGYREKVCAILPFDVADSHEAQIRLMDKCRRLQRLPPGLVPQAATR